MIRSGVYTGAVFVVALSLFLGSCATFNKTYPEKQLFSLDPDPGLEIFKGKPTGLLLVKEFDISPVYNTTAFVYRRDDVRFEIDYFNEFIVPVQRMITEEMETGLLDTGLFIPYSRNSDSRSLYRLSGKVIRISGDFREKNSPAAVIEIRVLLERWDEKTPQAVLSKHYFEKTAVKNMTPHDLVQGWNHGLEAVLQALYHDILNSL